MQTHLARAKERLNSSTVKLLELQVRFGYTTEYFSEQWKNQRRAQMDVISVTAQRKRERMKVLLELEEELIEAR